MSTASPSLSKESVVLAHKSAGWSPAVRIVFRLTFTYLVLSSLFWIFQFSDKSTAFIGRPYVALWRPLVQLIAPHLFDWKGPIELRFIYDTRYLYTLLLCFVLVSSISAAAWTLADKKRTEYSTLYRWLNVIVRYELAYMMLHYGMDKVFLLQFQHPTMAQLMERFGQYSPSSLMWRFIGASTSYTIFGGLAEVVGALLLLTRKTAILGALVTFAVMLNVAAMDFSYDVAVKMFTVNLLLMAAYLFVPQSGRLLNFFVLNRATEAMSAAPLTVGGWQRRMETGLKFCVVLYLLVPITLRDWRNYRMTGPDAPRPELYGLYEVQSFALDGQVRPPLVTDPVGWRYVFFEAKDRFTVEHLNEAREDYRMQYNAASHRLSYQPDGVEGKAESLSVKEPQPDSLTLVGTLKGNALTMTMHRIDRSEFPLVNRGFHWITESTYIH